MTEFSVTGVENVKSQLEEYLEVRDRTTRSVCRTDEKEGMM